jgi:hypothetical protein
MRKNSDTQSTAPSILPPSEPCGGFMRNAPEQVAALRAREGKVDCAPLPVVLGGEITSLCEDPGMPT